MKQLVVMMLGGARRVSMAELLKESGKRMGYDIKIVSYELLAQVPIAIIAKVEVGLKWTDPDVVADIVRVANEYKVNIILPFVDGAIEIASECRKHLPDVFIPVSEYETSRILFDKLEAAKAFKQHKLAIPKTYTAINADVPAIAKPRHGTSSRGIKVFQNIEDLMQLENLSEYLVQEYIQNREEYTVDCYVSQEGEVLVSVPRLRIEVVGGEVSRTKTFRIPELIESSHEVIRAFDLKGPVTLQFIHDLDKNRYLLMEVNPRLGGGVICSIYAGAPIPDYILKEALGVKVSPCNDWTDHTLMARYQKETIFFDYK
ncbi:MAG: ATP-grasp domain-containing protein [Prevotella sp.]|nr:ATP-grasp domain-containing protein [Bacteroides sp.]MCM1366454.1 ATP-grasp domain-containing protein [Prevotella sp.]MCM1437066.1 ATP-grasp domain-containing protein [Prevotella sp.]